MSTGRLTGRSVVEHLTLDHNLALDLLRVTEAAALAASQAMGQGDERAADQAAVDAMRQTLSVVPVDGTVVIGEGERDHAPMLFVGERVGNGLGPKVDFCLDPLEGAGIVAVGGPNAISAVAVAQRGGFLPVPDVYMEKIAIGPDLPEDLLDLDEPAERNLKELAKAKHRDIGDLVVCLLNRPRHDDLVQRLRTIGVRVILIGDGDVSAIMATAWPDSGIDLFLGWGGAPEGVLAATALSAMGGQMQGRLVLRDEAERKLAARAGITDPARKYRANELAHGHVLFAATGVTDGPILRGVRRREGHAHTHSIVMRSKTGTMRLVEGKHRLDRHLPEPPLD